MKDSLKLIFIISLIFLHFNCNYHNEEEYFNEICDTVNMSYSSDINPIIQNNCISCHNTSLNYKDRIYETYEGVKEVAETGLILQVIKHQPGVEGMPYQANKLPDCDIAKIEAWINQGIKNN